MVVVIMVVVIMVVVIMVAVIMVMMMPVALVSHRQPLFLWQLAPGGVDQNAEPEHLLAVLGIPSSLVLL